MENERIRKIIACVNADLSNQQEAMAQLEHLALCLYDEIESHLSVLREHGLAYECAIKRTRTSGGIDSLAFKWDDVWIIFLSSNFAALPNEGAKLPTKKPQGRIVVYITYNPNTELATPISEVYISPDGKWSERGFQYRDFEELTKEGIQRFVITLLESLTFRFTKYHNDKKRVLLDSNVVETKSPLGFRMEQE